MFQQGGRGDLRERLRLVDISSVTAIHLTEAKGAKHYKMTLKNISILVLGFFRLRM